MAVKNELGNIYGYLTVIARAENSKEGRAQWLCKCKCGKETVVLGKHLRSGNTKSCGCYQKERAIESNITRAEDLTDKRFGKLVAIKPDGFVIKNSGKRCRLWLCQCDCGNTCHIQHQYLTCGDTNSCGCINSVGNITISRILNQSNIFYKSEYSFKDFICISKPYQFDFALFNKNKQLLGLIEYQGDLHFTFNNKGWNTEERLKETQRRDEEKFEYCKKNNIKLFYITYKDDIQEKLKEILNELYSE